MDEKFEFWYPVVEEVQLDFEGREYRTSILKEGHITYSSVLMCGGSKEALKNSVGAKKEKVTTRREVTPKMCPKCLELWRNHPESQYYRFVRGYARETEIEKETITAAWQNA